MCIKTYECTLKEKDEFCLGKRRLGRSSQRRDIWLGILEYVYLSTRPEKDGTLCIKSDTEIPYHFPLVKLVNDERQMKDLENVFIRNG